MFPYPHLPPPHPVCRPKVRPRCPSRPARCSSPPAIREYDAKLLLAYWLERSPPVAPHATVKTNFSYPTAKVAQIAWDPETNTITPDSQLPAWVFTTKLVAKPDQLIKRRGKAGLLALNKSWSEAKQWIADRAGKPVQVSVSRSLERLRWELAPKSTALCLAPPVYSAFPICTAPSADSRPR